MEEYCMYCRREDCRRLKIMTWIADLQVSALHLYREQSYPGRCVLVYREHIQKLTELTPEKHAAFFKDVKTAACTLAELYQPDKINYLILGDLCPHLHIHLVPKYHDGMDWGKIFHMMPEPQKYLGETEEMAAVEKIREKLMESFRGIS